MKKNTQEPKNFFESVAHHNLERFHSETIAWLFNSFPLAGKAFIMAVYPTISSVDEIDLTADFCAAEENQIDIRLSFTYLTNDYKIIVENKLKASEHAIDAVKLLKKDKSFDAFISILSAKEITFLNYCLRNKVKLSQTEYYYFREKITRESSVVECKYVYLKPSRIDTSFLNDSRATIFKGIVNFMSFDELNIWNKAIGDNPWMTMTYSDLLGFITKSGVVINFEEVLQHKLNQNNQSLEFVNIIIANSYLEYLKNYIKENVNIENFNANERYAYLDYFKLLFGLVKSSIHDPTVLASYSRFISSDSIYEYIQAGSSNGGMPLFAFYKRIPVGKEFTCFNTNTTHIAVGVQIQGDNFKYYVSAENVLYDETIVIDQQTYKKFAEQTLLALDTSLGFKFNSNKTKTFFSRSYKIKDFIEDKKSIDNPRDIFSVAKEISIKVNLFIKNDTSKIVQDMTQKLISKI